MTIHSPYQPLTQPTHDVFNQPIDVNVLVDKEYHSFSDRKTVLTASFSRVADFSTLEIGDSILAFMPYDEWKTFTQQFPVSRLGALALGVVDMTSNLPVLLTIKSVHLDDHNPKETRLRFKQGLGVVGLYYKQVWRFIG